MDAAIKALVKGVALSEWPPLACPVCGKHTLMLVQEEQIWLQSAGSLAYEERFGGDPEYIAGEFAVALRCQDSACRTSAISVGNMWVGYAPDYEHSGGYEYHLQPKAIHPAVPLFDCPPKTPSAIVGAIRSASAVFWADPGAAANKLRTAVDEILNAKRVRKTTTTKKGKRLPLTTHARCEVLAATDPDLSRLLLAVKWIGNEGSHSLSLTHDELLDGAWLLRGAIRLIWADESRELQALARRVARTKGKRRTFS